MASRKTVRTTPKKKNLRFALIWAIILVICLLVISIAHYGSVGAWIDAIKNGGQTGPLVVIDAGHGGSDEGASSGDQIEKDETLAVAKLVAKDLKADGYRVLMTREEDTNVSLQERAQAANAAKADAFVSIHRNMYNGEKTDVKGVEIWISHEQGEQETQLANAVMDRLLATGYVMSRGIKSGSMDDPNTDYYVVRETQMPAILIELGFLSNEDDRAMVQENAGTTARAIADGIKDYLTAQQETENSTSE